MDREKAIELLKKALNEINQLRELRYNNQEYHLWFSKIRVILEDTFGSDSKEYQTFSRSGSRAHIRTPLIPDSFYQDDYLANLTSHETTLKSILQKYEILGIESETAPEPEIPISPVTLYDAMNLHPKVVELSKQLFKDGHYRDAIYRAFVEVNNFVKDKANNQLDGKRLMSTVFSLDNPIIKLNSLQTQSDRAEQEGFMFLFMGAMEGIRNPKAHENIIQNDPHRTLEYLGLASLLMKIAEEGHL